MKELKLWIVNALSAMALILICAVEVRADEHCPSDTPSCPTSLCADGPYLDGFNCCAAQGANCCQYLCQKYECVVIHGPCPPHVVWKVFGNLHLNKSCHQVHGECRNID